MRLHTRVVALVLAALFAGAAYAEDAHADECPAVKSLKIMHFRQERGHDAVYDRLRDDSRCDANLIAALRSVELMQDPRQTPVEPRFVVGDAALFILMENYGIEFADLLPPKVMANWDRQGVYAYFDYVQAKKNRAKVIARLRALMERVERGVGINPPAMKLKLEFGRSGAPLAVKIDVTNQNAKPICLPRNFAARTRLAAIRNGKRLEQFNSIEGRPIRGCTTLPSRQTVSFTHDLVVMYPNDRLANTSICFTLNWKPGVTERAPVRLKSSCVKSPRVSQGPETRTWRAAIETYVREKRGWSRDAYRIEFIERRRNVLTFYVIPLVGEKCLMCRDKPDAFVVEVDPAKRKVVAELALQ